MLTRLSLWMAGLFLLSCTKEDLSLPEAPLREGDAPGITLTADEAERLPLFERSFNRSHTEVLAIADRLMSQVAEDERQTQTKSLDRGVAVLADSIVIAMPVTKRVTEQMPAQAKIYTVNFGQDAGYTLIAGDKRVRQAVLAYDGSGKFELETDNPGAQLAMEYMQLYVQTEIERLEAMRGDSIYAALEARYGFGAAGRGDGLAAVGGLTKSSYAPPYEPAVGMPGSSPDYPYGTQQGSNWQVVSDGITWYWAPVDNLVTAESSGAQQLMIVTYPLCRSQWGQRWPYDVEVVKTNPGCPAGCVATAMAQIMRFHKKPTAYSWDAYGFNLSSKLLSPLRAEYGWEYKSTAAVDNVGLLFKNIGLDVGMNYQPSGSSVHSDSVPIAMWKYGYASYLEDLNVSTLSYYLQTQKRPVYVSGARVGSAHAWVVDGLSRYADYSYQYYNAYYQGQYVGYVKVSAVNYYVDIYPSYFHCNWGWNGQDDGWYLTGTFNPASVPNSYNSFLETVYVNY